MLDDSRHRKDMLMGSDAISVLIPVTITILLPIVWLVGNYNVLVRLRNYCDEAWAQIDTELKRRYDLIPNLVATVKGYATHESETLEKVVALRDQAAASNGSPAEQAMQENKLVGGLKSLIAVAESYPDLKASANFLSLQEELSNTEDRIQAARRFYNANVRDLNTRTEIIPSNVVASVFGFKKKEFFEIESAVERDVPQVKLN